MGLPAKQNNEQAPPPAPDALPPMAFEQPPPGTTTARVADDIKNLQNRLHSLIENDRFKNKISFGSVVLKSVAQGDYDRAIKELELVGIGFEEYPAFAVRTQRQVEHAKSLVLAIKTKHEVGKSAHINRSKQKELSDKITEHFVELKKTLINIEKIQKSVRSSDLSSATVFFKSSFFAVAAVFLVYTFYQVSHLASDFSLMDIFGFFTLMWPE